MQSFRKFSEPTLSGKGKERRMKCTKCSYYSYGLRRCKLGKVPVRGIKDGASMIQFMGVEYACAIDEENRAKRDKAITLLQAK